MDVAREYQVLGVIVCGESFRSFVITFWNDALWLWPDWIHGCLGEDLMSTRLTSVSGMQAPSRKVRAFRKSTVQCPDSSPRLLGDQGNSVMLQLWDCIFHAYCIFCLLLNKSQALGQITGSRILFCDCPPCPLTRQEPSEATTTKQIDLFEKSSFPSIYLLLNPVESARFTEAKQTVQSNKAAADTPASSNINRGANYFIARNEFSKIWKSVRNWRQDQDNRQAGIYTVKERGLPTLFVGGECWVWNKKVTEGDEECCIYTGFSSALA